VAKVKERLTVDKPRSHSFHIERFNLQKLNEVESKEKYHVEVSIVLQLWKILKLSWILIVLGTLLERT
jgi:hypothetical protein